jgi:isopropylmalate/homocitrate/citramalate synthase
VVGTGAFAHESGMVVAGVLEDPFTAEPYDPALVGQQRVIQLGKKSGLVSLNARLAQLELDPPASVRADLLERVKDLALAERRAITDDELVQLVASATGTNGERR